MPSPSSPSPGTSAATTLVDRLRHHARAAPAHDAVVRHDLRLSYAELAGRVDQHADALAQAGVGAGTVLGLRCDDDVEHLVLCLAASACGAATASLPSHASALEDERLLERLGANAVLGEGGNLVHRAAADGNAAPALEGGDAGLFFATSGTTGEAKIVVQSSTGLVLQAPRHVFGPGERFACRAGMEHNFARRHRLYCVAQGGTNVFLSGDLAQLPAEREALRFTTLHLSVFQARELLAAPGVGPFPNLRLKLGGSHAPAALRNELRARVSTHLECGYGTTETGAIGFSDPADEDALETVGRALPGLAIRICGASGSALPAGERGQVMVRADGLFHGYLGQPELTAERLEGGWFCTGDVGRLDASGRLRLEGRADEMFVFNSMNIVPQELEGVLLEHPEVEDVVVLPKASPVHGDVPVALVVRRRDGAADERALKAFARERLGVRSPRLVRVVSNLPRNEGGKVDRTAARQLLDSAQRS